jgi:putative ABC transport system substrate-binding protein
MDYRFAPDSSINQIRPVAKELIALRPEVIFAHSTPVIAGLHHESREIPIVFAGIADPIGSGFITSLPRPGGHITGVMQYEASVTGKWLAMLNRAKRATTQARGDREGRQESFEQRGAAWVMMALSHRPRPGP